MGKIRKKISWKEPDLSNKKSKLFLKISFRLLFLAFIFLTGYIFFFSSFLKINRVYLDGLEELPSEKVNSRIKSLIEGKYFNIVHRNNFILVSKERIAASLLGEFKKLSRVEVQKEFPDTLKIKVEERKSLIIWCSGGPCYLVDEEGYGYSGADFESKEIRENNLIKIVDIGATPVDLGEKILESGFIGFVLRIRDNLKNAADIEIENEYRTWSVISRELEVKSNEGWSLYLSSQVAPGKSAKTLGIFLAEKISPEERKNLEYVDLRIENKIFYKIKNTDQVKEEKGEIASPEPADDDKDKKKKD